MHGEELKQKFIEHMGGYSHSLMMSHVNEPLHEGIMHWVVYGIEPGDFLRAVLRNDMMDAMGRADDINRHRMFELCTFLYNGMPAGSYGSRERYAAWKKKGGLEGRPEDGA